MVPADFQGDDGNTALDLSGCETEPIHLLGRIQSFGFLVAVSYDWIIQFVSANSGDWLGEPPEKLIGRPLAEVVDSAFLHEVRNQVQMMAGEAGERSFGVAIRPGGAPCDVAVHTSGRRVILECEPAAPMSRAEEAMIRRVMRRLHEERSFDALSRNCVSLVQAITGFDRVMLYRFMHDGSGEVIAEAAEKGLEPYLNLRYPASDIPAQARELYRRTPIRIIYDVEDEPVELVPATDTTGSAADLSASVLRSVSPIHIQYLRNMGVASSMSLSIVVNGVLWGLIACHHMEPRRLSLAVRTQLELVAQIVSLELESRERDEAAAADAAAQDFHELVIRKISSSDAPVETLLGFTDTMQQMIPSNGVALYVDGEVYPAGLTPSDDQIAALARYLNGATGESVFETCELPRIYPDADAFEVPITGLLAIPISRTPRDYLMFFRQEVVRSVTWAGNPDKAASFDPRTGQISPRESFKAWRELVRGQSEPWVPGQVRLAERMRHTLIEVILKQADSLDTARRLAQERQELLIAELNHRVRNILGLIRGLIKQTSDPGLSVQEYISLLQDRVQALARAHDQITNDNWAAAPLHSLVRVETEAYLGEKAGRVSLVGPNVMLEPKAYVPVALVMHELTTNSAKYGALCDRRGRVTLTSAFDADGNLLMHWKERDGPPVQAPQRQGFGTTIIERSIPFELNGTALVEYRLEGLEAHFCVPADYVRPFAGEAAESDQPESVPVQDISFSGNALLVEDNIIIALDADEMLSGLGFSYVEIASNTPQALELIDSSRFDVGLLDINLGNETSFAVADRLMELGVPFVFLSGYGDSEERMPDRFRGIHVIQKPYDASTLRTGLAHLLDRT